MQNVRTRLQHARKEAGCVLMLCEEEEKEEEGRG